MLSYSSPRARRDTSAIYFLFTHPCPLLLCRSSYNHLVLPFLRKITQTMFYPSLSLLAWLDTASVRPVVARMQSTLLRGERGELHALMKNPFIVVGRSFTSSFRGHELVSMFDVDSTQLILILARPRKSLKWAAGESTWPNKTAQISTLKFKLSSPARMVSNIPLQVSVNHLVNQRRKRILANDSCLSEA